MLFARLYIDVYTHPRFLDAGLEASGYWMHVLAFLRHGESSDGFLDERFMTVPLNTNKLVARRLCDKLVSVGLFGKVEGGYVLLRYAEKNDTKEAIEENRKAQRERKSRWKKGKIAAAGQSPEPRTAPAPNGAENAPGTHSGHGTRDSPSSAQPAVRGPLPPSERALSGPYWLAAFSDGITQHTGRPCTVGRMYLATLERIVTHHASERDPARASDWIHEQAKAFAKKWDGHHPAKGLTPDGLERWLNDGRPSPPQFGKPRIVQPAASEWKPDDFSDYGAQVLTAESDEESGGESGGHSGGGSNSSGDG